MGRRVRDKVVVITGASSGIGRATAEAFAAEGATLVLAARRGQVLDELARSCQRLGGRAFAVPTDVRDERAVQRLALVAAERFGRIDVWVNNAAVTLFSRVDDGPTEAIRQVVETNLLGCIYGVRSVLPYFQEQGEGTLVVVDAVVAGAPQPYTSAYVASKSAIRSYAECLRMELSLDGASKIHVCMVLPASIDTPFFRHAGNYTGRAVRPMKPVNPPERVARAILKVARRPRREVIVGLGGRVVMTEHALVPRFYEWLGARMVDRGHFEDRSAERTSGNLFRPLPGDGRVRGGWLANGGAGRAGKAAAGLLAVGVPAAALWAWHAAGRRLGR